MKILLVNPPNCGRSIPEEEYGIDTIKMIFRGEPLSLEVLAGNLDTHEVVITDLKVTPDALADTMNRFAPDVVGLTGVTCEANTVLRLAREIKNHSRATVVAGGHHASCDPDFFNQDGIDYIIAGLGKRSFRELIDALENRAPAPDIPGVAKTSPGKPLSFSRRVYSFQDLVDTRPPRYDLVQANRNQYVMSGVGGKVGFVASAYGCTHCCAFCSIPNITHGRYISHQPDAVIRDMQLLGDIPTIRLVDANTFGDPETAWRLGRQIIESGLKKAIVADVRSDTVTRHPDLFRLWKEAGLSAAVIGFEEITDARLERLNKKSSVAVNIQAIHILKELGIRIIGDFIVSPEYAESDFDALRRFVYSHSIDLPIPSILTPLPGTPLYRKMADHIFLHDLDYYTFTNAIFPTRMDPKLFYQAYADLLTQFLKHITHK